MHFDLINHFTLIDEEIIAEGSDYSSICLEKMNVRLIYYSNYIFRKETITRIMKNKYMIRKECLYLVYKLVHT